MTVTINGTTGIIDADGGSVLSSADIASLGEAQAKTDNTKVMTPLRVAQAINLVSLGSTSTNGVTTRTISGLDLTGYVAIFVLVSGVSHNAGTGQQLIMGTGQISTNARAAGDLLSGVSFLSLGSGSTYGSVNIDGSTPTPRHSATGITNASTSISFTWDAGGSFDAGTITIWGIRA